MNNRKIQQKRQKCRIFNLELKISACHRERWKPLGSVGNPPPPGLPVVAILQHYPGKREFRSDSRRTEVRLQAILGCGAGTVCRGATTSIRAARSPQGGPGGLPLPAPFCELRALSRLCLLPWNADFAPPSVTRWRGMRRIRECAPLSRTWHAPGIDSRSKPRCCSGRSGTADSCWSTAPNRFRLPLVSISTALPSHAARSVSPRYGIRSRRGRAHQHRV